MAIGGNGEEYISKNAVPSSLVSMEIDVFEIMISANGRSVDFELKIQSLLSVMLKNGKRNM